MKKLHVVLTILASAAVLAACGSNTASESSATDTPSSSEPAKVARPKVVDSYVASENASNAYGGVDSMVYQVNLLEGNVYELAKTTVTYAYSQVLGTTSVFSYGTYSKGASEDGYTKYTLNLANDVILNSYSKAGGFSLSVNTNDQTYPVELPAVTQGDKNMANSKADVINSYGLGAVIYAADGKNTFSFVDPNAENPGEPETITAASGNTDAVFASKIKDVKISGYRTAGGYGDSSYNACLDQVITFEDGTYETTSTVLMFGYNMVLGTTTTYSYGAAAYGASEDGITTVTLAKADDVVFNAFSLAGGFNIEINTSSASQTYPCELMASGEGEKPMANSKADVIEAYGKEKTVYFYNTSCELSATNPNA